MAAATRSTAPLRFFRLTSAAMSRSSAALVVNRSSQKTSGTGNPCSRCTAKFRMAWIAGPSRPSNCSGNPNTTCSHLVGLHERRDVGDITVKRPTFKGLERLRGPP